MNLKKLNKIFYIFINKISFKGSINYLIPQTNLILNFKNELINLKLYFRKFDYLALNFEFNEYFVKKKINLIYVNDNHCYVMNFKEIMNSLKFVKEQLNILYEQKTIS